MKISSFSACEPSFLVPVTEGGVHEYHARDTHPFDGLCASKKKSKQSKIPYVTLQNTYQHVKKSMLIPDKAWFNHRLTKCSVYWRPRTWLRVVIRVSLAVRASFWNGANLADIYPL